MPKNDDFEARRRSRQREIKRRRRKKTLILFSFICVITVVVLCFTVFFRVERVNVSGSDVYDAVEIAKAAGVNNKNMFTISSTKLEDKIRQKLPYVDSVKLSRKLPHTVTLKVTDAAPFSYYLVGSKYYIASEKGYILEESKSGSNDLMQIICSEAVCKVGKKVTIVSEREQKLIDELITYLNDEQIPTGCIDVSNPASIKLKVADRFSVNLGTSDYLIKKISHLKGMIDNIDPEKSGDIDLSMWSPENSQGSFLKKQ